MIYNLVINNLSGNIIRAREERTQKLKCSGLKNEGNGECVCIVSSCPLF